LSELLAKRYCICDAKKSFSKDSGLEPKKKEEEMTLTSPAWFALDLLQIQISNSKD
jgi:hypothetical protein